eukprot:1180589-Prorocentrum_minimum.AAC.1
MGDESGLVLVQRTVGIQMWAIPQQPHRYKIVKLLSLSIRVTDSSPGTLFRAAYSTVNYSAVQYSTGACPLTRWTESGLFVPSLAYLFQVWPIRNASRGQPQSFPVAQRAANGSALAIRGLKNPPRAASRTGASAPAPVSAAARARRTRSCCPLRPPISLHRRAFLIPAAHATRTGGAARSLPPALLLE